jgi:D-proline reductase (dithiol) PrdB
VLTSKLEAAQQRIRRSNDPNFAWVTHDVAPWSRLRRPLGQSTVALVSTCGLYRLDSHVPFDAWNDLGDPSFREIHMDTPRERLRISHAHYDHTQISADVNVAIPLDCFRRLAEQGAVGRLYPWVHSFMGYLPEPRELMVETAPAVARRLAEDRVDAAFLTPC